MTTAEKLKLNRRTWIMFAAAAVLVVSAVSVFLVNATAGPASKQYEISATGNLRAMWFTDTSTGTLDMTTGSGGRTVTGRSASVSVDSTLPEGASCRIEGPNGETYVDHAPANGDAIVTATCSTPAVK